MTEEPSRPTPTTMYTEGRRLLEEGRTVEAIQAIEKAVTMRPENAGWLAGLGMAYVKAGRLEDGVAAFQDAKSQRPEEHRYALLYASTLLKLGRHSEAKATFETALAKDPSLVAAWQGLGRAATALNDLAAAKAAYGQVIAADPLNVAGHEALARIAEASGDAEAALRHRGAVATARPDHAPSQLAHAKGLMLAERFSDAAEAYRRVLAIQPAHPSARAILEELETWSEVGSPASKEASVRYYDAIYSGDNVYSRDANELEGSRHFGLICDHLMEVRASSVLDLGCGPGQFAQYLRSRMAIPYVGLDFSQVAIERANQRGIADARFAVFDITRDPLPALDRGAAIVCTEVLEHVEGDLDVIAHLPAGHHCCCSVPNFYTFSHVRHFTEVAEVERRYGTFFDDMRIVDIPLGKGSNRLFLFFAQRNGVGLDQASG